MVGLLYLPRLFVYHNDTENLSEMESIIKQLPLVQQLIKENEELKRRLDSENIQFWTDGSNVSEFELVEQTD